jgi:hypothetical protein
MQLKSQQEIDAVVAAHQGKVPRERAEQIVATIRATRPERMDELDAIFSENLSDEEKAFYHDIVEEEAKAEAPAAAAPGVSSSPSHE